MSEKSVRIGIIGAGANTRDRHIPGLQAIEGVTIVGVCNRTRESSRRATEQFGIDRIYDDWQAAAADPDTDAIVIGTWPYLHCPATLASLAAGKHVLCEARMAMNADEAHRMLTASREKPDLVTQIVPSPFTLRVDEAIKKLLAEGTLGELLAAEVQAGAGFIDRHSAMTWRQDADLSGLNVMSLGIYYEAMLRWIGPVRRVTAMARTFVNTRPDGEGKPQPIRIPDHVDVLAEFESGPQGRMRISNVIGLADSGIFLYGSEATLKLADNTLYLGRRGQDSLAEFPVPAELEGRWRVEEEFIGAIRGQEQVKLSPFEVGVQYMEFTEAVARSVESGRAIAIPLTGAE